MGRDKDFSNETMVLRAGKYRSADSDGNCSSGPEDEVKKRHGHPRFYDLLEEIADLHSRKNHDYAAGGHPLGNFYRRAQIYAMYPGLDLSDPAVIALVDMIKQFDAVLWMYSNKHKALVENKRDRLRDMSVYTLIAMVLEEEKLKAASNTSACGGSSPQE